MIPATKLDDKNFRIKIRAPKKCHYGSSDKKNARQGEVSSFTSEKFTQTMTIFLISY